MNPDSHLPSVHSLAELSLVVELARREGYSHTYKRGMYMMYMGGRMKDGKVEWVDGSPSDFTFWEEGYPPVNHRGCLAVAVFSSMGWKDAKCQVEEEEGGDLFTCQIHLSSSNTFYQLTISEEDLFLCIYIIIVLFLGIIISLSVRHFPVINSTILSYISNSVILTADNEVRETEK